MKLLQLLPSPLRSGLRFLTRRRSPPPARAPRVLVVEDNAASRLLAREMLESLGCRADGAVDGREAVAALERSAYDLVLMDCQMPVMDGFRATAEIRRRQDDGDRTPIVAVTAGHLRDDRRRALEAGMDDYVAKPLRFERLRGLLARWTGWTPGDEPPPAEPTAGPPRGEAPPEVPSTEVPSAEVPSAEVPSAEVPSAEVLARLPGARGFDDEDLDLFVNYVTLFLGEVPKHLRAMRRALDQGDTDELRRIGHTVKGSSAFLGVDALIEAGRALEQAGAAGDLDVCRPRVERLEAELETLRRRLHG